MTPLDATTVGGTPRAEGESLAPGEVLATRWRILETLGRGGMGIVYRARDTTLGADVALKVLPPAVARDPRRVAFFAREVKLAHKVTHVNVCRLHDLVEADGRVFITMELIDGASLAHRLAEGPLERERALAILGDVARALEAAHAAGVVHRDLKPGNVLLREDGRSVVGDFGIATEVEPAAAATGEVAGTQGWMSPEQATGGRVDARSDVYAFGLLAMTLLGSDPGETWTELVHDCLASDPDDRPANGAVLVRRLEDRPPRRREWLVLVALAVAAAAGLIVREATRQAPTVWPETTAPPRIVIEPFAPRGLAAEDGWLADALGRVLVDELDDAWALDARAASDGEIAGAARVVVGGEIARDATGRLQVVARARLGPVELAIQAEGDALRPLVELLAGRLARAVVPPRLRSPREAELTAAGAREPEAWRAWRRAQRESRMQRWNRARLLCRQAIARDPEFPLAWLELAFSYEAIDRAFRDNMVEANARAGLRPDLSPVWRQAVLIGNEIARGDLARSDELAAAMPLDTMSERELLYYNERWAYGLHYRGLEAQALPMIEGVAERWPADAAAWKFLAATRLENETRLLARAGRRYAEQATRLAPDDVAVRAMLAFALALDGDAEAARAHARIVERADAEEKRFAATEMFYMHMTLGDREEAGRDGRRQAAGNPSEQLSGRQKAAWLALDAGRFREGLDEFEAIAAAYDANGLQKPASRMRTHLGALALQLGETARARKALEAAAAASPRARVLAAIAAGVSAERSASPRLAILASWGAGDASGALRAYRALDADELPPIDVLWPVAESFERAGDHAEAERVYRLLATRGDRWLEPIASVRAWGRVAALRERAGDRAGAKAAWEALLARWGRLPEEPPEAREARRAIAELSGGR